MTIIIILSSYLIGHKQWKLGLWKLEMKTEISGKIYILYILLYISIVFSLPYKYFTNKYFSKKKKKKILQTKNDFFQNLKNCVVLLPYVKLL